MLNQTSELIIQAKAGQKRINNANGTKTYQVAKHIGQFHDVFRGTDDVEGKVAYTLACEVPLRAQIYWLGLFLVPRSGKSGFGLEYPIANANVSENKMIIVQVGVMPLNVMRDLNGSYAGANLNDSILSKIKEYCVSADDNEGFNLYGNKLKEGSLYSIMHYAQTLQTATANQSFPSEISLDVISQSSYAPIVSCRHASYNVFATQDRDVLDDLNADGRDRKIFKLASGLSEGTQQADNRYNAFNSGTGIIVVRSFFCRADNGAAASSANYNALFNDAKYNNTDVVLRLIYGEPYDDDITAMSTEYFIR